MAKTNGKPVKQLQDFVMDRLEEAKERLAGFEDEAQDVLKSLMAKGKQQRKELEALMNKVNTADLRAFEARHGEAAGQEGLRGLHRGAAPLRGPPEPHARGHRRGQLVAGQGESTAS